MMGKIIRLLTVSTLFCFLLSPSVFSGDLRAGGIRVVSATYGGNCGVAKGNATAHIAEQCNGKTKCQYTVDHKIIGDPAYGCAKTYTVRYRCGNNTKVFEQSLSEEAGWGDKSVVLKCKQGITKFMYNPKVDIGAPTNREGTVSR